MINWSKCIAIGLKQIIQLLIYTSMHHKKTSRESRKAAPRTYNQLLRGASCFTKCCHYYYCHYCYCHYWHYYYCLNLNDLVLSLFDFWVGDSLNFWVLSNFEFLVLSQFEFLSLVTIWLFGLSQFEFLGFVTTWGFEFCHNLCSWVLSQFDFCHNFSFWVLSQFYFLSFVTISVFESCHNLSS